MEPRAPLRAVRIAGAVLTFIGWVVTIRGLVTVANSLNDDCTGRECEEVDTYWSYLAYQIFVLACVALSEAFGGAEFTCLSLLGLCMVASCLDQWAADIFRTGVDCGNLAFAGWTVMAAGDILMIIGLGYKRVVDLKAGMSGRAGAEAGAAKAGGEPLMASDCPASANGPGAAADPPPTEQELPQDFEHGRWVYPVMALIALGGWLVAVAGARKWCDDFDCAPLKFYWWIMALEAAVLLFVFIMRVMGRLTPWTQVATFMLAMPTTFLAIWSHNFVHLAREEFPDEKSLRAAAGGTIALAVTNYLLAFTWASIGRVLMVLLGIAGLVIAVVGVVRTRNYLCKDNDELFDEELLCNKFRLYWWFFVLEGAVLTAFFIGLFAHLKAGWASVTLTFAAVAAVWPILVADEFRVFPSVTEGTRDEQGFEGHLIMAVAFLALVVLEMF
eukprot:evm.model.scf_21EXC.20 EVM.evm.TU.scf_21EXC.20   scf_21EXC:195835-197579(-)